MKPSLYALSLALAISLPALAQDPTVTPQSTPPRSNTPQPQSNAEPATKPAGAKGSSLIGCLSGPDKDGKYVLRSMQHRTGVHLGPDNLKDDSGSKVKLTGSWVAADQSQQGKEGRRFQASEVEVMATNRVPAEATPVSKNKQQKKSTPSGNPGYGQPKMNIISCHSEQSERADATRGSRKPALGLSGSLMLEEI